MPLKNLGSEETHFPRSPVKTRLHLILIFEKPHFYMTIIKYLFKFEIDGNSSLL